jgi:hypothetical protein
VQLCQRLFEHLSRLCAQDQELAVQDERGNAVRADSDRLLGRDRYALRVVVAGYDSLNVVGGESNVARERAQDAVVADVRAFLPVGVHQPVVECLVQAAVPRELREAERSERARDDVARRRVCEAVRLERLLEAVVEGLPVARVKLLARNSFRWILRVQVERQVRDRGAVPAP